MEAGVRWCEHGRLGLTHQKMNLDCMLELAAASNRTLRLPALRLPARHTGCADAMDGDWTALYDFADQPVAWHAHARPAPSHGGPAARAHVALDGARALDELMRATAPTLTLRLGSFGKFCNHYHFCAQFSRALLSRRPRLRESAVVLRVADRITAKLGGAGGYRALHFRQGDKLDERNPRLGLPRLSPKELALRMLLLDPPLRGEPLYVATDAPATVRTACMRACFDVRTRLDFQLHLRDVAPPESRRRRAGCPSSGVVNGFGVLAVEVLLMERARCAATDLSRAVLSHRCPFAQSPAGSGVWTYDRVDTTLCEASCPSHAMYSPSRLCSRLAALSSIRRIRMLVVRSHYGAGIEQARRRRERVASPTAPASRTFRAWRTRSFNPCCLLTRVPSA